MQIKNAKSPEDIFGKDEEVAKSIYKDLAKKLHPDAGGSDEEFALLSSLWIHAQKKMEDGTYGKYLFQITAKKFTIDVFEELYRGDISNIYHGKFQDVDCLIKIPRNSKDNDIIISEQKSLRKLYDNEDLEKARPYVPRLLKNFKAPISGGQRNVSVLEKIDGLFSITEVVKRKAASGSQIHPKDMAWMFRRLLIAINYAHKSGIIHGGITPDNVLIHPEQHGLILCGWTASVEPANKITVVSQRWWNDEDEIYLYPNEVLNKEPVGPGTDIWMAVKTMQYLLKDSVDSPGIRRFFRGCLLERENRRPQDALHLLHEFDELIVRLWGPRTYRPFSL
jgi:serine/threonine protein kinase